MSDEYRNLNRTLMLHFLACKVNNLCLIFKAKYFFHLRFTLIHVSVVLCRTWNVKYQQKHIIENKKVGSQTDLYGR